MCTKIVGSLTSKISPYAIPGLSLSISNIELAACQTWNISPADLYRKVRTREIVEARMSVMKYRRENSKVSLHTLQRETGFDHSTVIHAIRTVNNLLQVDKPFKIKHEKFLQTIKNQTV